jgi:hypothetical protein
MTMRWLVVLGTAGVALAALPAQAQSGMTAAERAELESLRQRMAALEAQVAQRAQAEAQHEAQQEAQRVEHDAQQAQHEAQQAERPVEAEADLDGNPEHAVSVYGFAQIDAIQDFKRVHPDWDATLRPSRIPTVDGQYGSDGQFIASVRQSRFGVKASGMVAGKPYEAKFEFDLYGTGVDAGQTTFRIRHAYGRWGPILAGQTNTLFMDGDIFPNVVDYWGPAGMVFVRTPQIRFTFYDRDGVSAAIAFEHPSDDIDPGQIRLVSEDIANGLRPDEEFPDFTAAVRYGGEWGHVRLAGIARSVGYDTLGTPGNEPKGDEFGWGLNLTGSVKAGFATFRAGVVYGEGIATYMNDGGMDLAPSAALGPVPPIFPPPPISGTLISAEAVPLLGISAYADLQWTPELSSAIGYSFTEVDNTNFQDPTAFHKGEYASANLLWTPADRVMTGAELLWGRRTDNDGADGDDVRLQYTFKLSFDSGDLLD